MKKSLNPKKYLIPAVLVLVALVGALQFTSNKVSAAPVLGFNAGNIIDDAVFTNTTTMNTAQIQSFFISKVPVCDTNGTQTSEYGGGTRAQWGQAKYGQSTFTCLKDYSENGKTSAQIIYDAAQEFQINPQVLIVLLQKEQGLVNDTWPLNVQYRTATGYGCPDTAACDSQYFGLTNQVRWSARMFRAILNKSPTWYTPYVLGNNYIQWSPSSSCGGTTVNIQNRSTQALYNYTPYQPNSAALNAGYGSGDSCSAYGNRNFYAYFTDWFGSVRYIFGAVPSSQSVYARRVCTVRYFASDAVGRLYNPDNRDFLYTRDYNEACSAIKNGYIWDDVVMLNATGSDAIPVYRLANSIRHIYTYSTAVRDSAIVDGYANEGISYYVYATTGANRTAVYGLQRADTYFVTSSGKEAEYYASTYGYTNLGTVYYTPVLGPATQVDVSRLVRLNQRVYTPHDYEIANAKAYGYKDEGTVAKVDIIPNPYDMPVYRTRSQDGIYNYTTDRIQRDTAIINYGHTAEGIPFYSLMWSNKPVYGAWNPYNGFRVYASVTSEYTDATQNYSYNPSGIAWYSY